SLRNSSTDNFERSVSCETGSGLNFFLVCSSSRLRRRFANASRSCISVVSPEKSAWLGGTVKTFKVIARSYQLFFQ
ncbi:unnamed protein product, partial [Adineta steineri]